MTHNVIDPFEPMPFICFIFGSFGSSYITLPQPDITVNTLYFFRAQWLSPLVQGILQEDPSNMDVLETITIQEMKVEIQQSNRVYWDRLIIRACA